jgi:DNA-binding transcriptional MerR regulator
MNGKWRIDQLMKLAVRALEQAPPAGQLSGRVRDVPDIRTIRYYTTIGLIDRPAEIRGRTAFYGPRHLRQLVAVKRLQAQGMSLVQIQESLTGVSSRKLDQLAELPLGFIEAALATNFEAIRGPREDATLPNLAAAPSPAGNRARFWSTLPDVASTSTSTISGRAGLLPQQLAVILPLDHGVSLVLEGVAPEQLNAEVVASLEPAVEVLCDTLARAGLSRRCNEVGTGQFDQLSKHEGDENESHD